ncbi:MAG TPA: hypothetical protein VNF49_12415 [Candidatus Binataceae bacterium]|nr:hypothetical protein [Candidatus Binataceae bacterium]
MSDQAMHPNGRDRPALQKADQQSAEPVEKQMQQSRTDSTKLPEGRGIPGPGRKPLFGS